MTDPQQKWSPSDEDVKRAREHIPGAVHLADGRLNTFDMVARAALVAGAGPEVERRMAQAREAEDAHGRKMLVLREEQLNASDVQALAYYPVGGEQPQALSPHQVSGILEHLERKAREAVDWSLYDSWEQVRSAEIDKARFRTGEAENERDLARTEVATLTAQVEAMRGALQDVLDTRDAAGASFDGAEAFGEAVTRAIALLATPQQSAPVGAEGE